MSQDGRSECIECGSPITIDGRNGTKIASLRGGTCFPCHESGDGNE